MEQFRTSSGNDSSSCSTWMSSRKGGRRRSLRWCSFGSALVQLGVDQLYMVQFGLWCGSVWCGLSLNGSALVQLWFSCGLHNVIWSSTGVVQLWFSLVVV